MKIQIVSDLHIEFADFTLPETNADVIVLAGDIGGAIGSILRRKKRAELLQSDSESKDEQA